MHKIHHTSISSIVWGCIPELLAFSLQKTPCQPTNVLRDTIALVTSTCNSDLVIGYSLAHTGRLKARPFSAFVSADFEPKHPIRACSGRSQYQRSDNPHVRPCCQHGGQEQVSQALSQKLCRTVIRRMQPQVSPRARYAKHLVMASLSTCLQIGIVPDCVLIT